MQNIIEDLKDALKTQQQYLEDGEHLLKNKIIQDAFKLAPSLIKCLLSSPTLKEHFFADIDGVMVFDSLKFQKFVSNKSFLPDSYTAFKNKIGLGDGTDKFLKNSNDIVLSWAYKDCILEGGMSKEDVKGNNLLALYSLRKKYAGKIKLIYIDPPYNTGGDGFRYNDNFNHSTWLTFMKNRLEVARELLSDDGCIFVNLDDGESHYCKILMDEIWGRNNFVANIIWQKKYAPQNDARWFSDNHDHILCFAKNKDKWRPVPLPRNDKQNQYYVNDDNNGRGLWRTDNILVKSFTKDRVFPIVNPNTQQEFLPPTGRCWRYTQETVNSMLRENRLYFGKNGKGAPQVKRYLNEVKDGVTPLTVWLRDDFGDNQEAKKEICNLDFDGIFQTPKPERLIQRIIHIATKSNDIVLDFFAGSGTTPAVAHKMGRRWIAIEQMDYIRDLPEARIKKVIEGEQGGISKAVNWQGGGSFIYMELAEWNEAFMTKIQQADSTETLLGIYDDLKDSTFLNYKLHQEKFDFDDFKALPLNEQKHTLCEILNKNHLYVNYSEIDDSEYNISDNDKKLTHQFYKGV